MKYTLTTHRYDNIYGFIDIENIEVGLVNWRTFPTYDNDFDTCCELERMLNSELNCTRVYNGVIFRTIHSYNYKYYCYIYYRLLLSLRNQLLYNKYVDKLIDNHNINIEMYLNTKEDCTPKTKKKKNTTRKKKDKYIRETTTDIFTGETIYVYENTTTGEQITSKDGSLLDSLNSKVAKKKKSKAMPFISNISFKFNK